MLRFLSTLTAALLLGSPALADNPDAGKMAWYYCVAKDYPDMSVLVVQQESEFGTDASAFVPGNENYEEVFVQSHFNVYQFEFSGAFYNESDDSQTRAKALYENRDKARRTFIEVLGSRPIDSLDVVYNGERVFGYSSHPDSIGSVFSHDADNGIGNNSYNLLCEEPWSVDAQ